MTAPKHQAIFKTDGSDIVMHVGELIAVLRCAGTLADHEGMPRTADRLRNDADKIRELYDVHHSLNIEVR